MAADQDASADQTAISCRHAVLRVICSHEHLLFSILSGVPLQTCKPAAEDVLSSTEEQAAASPCGRRRDFCLAHNIRCNADEWDASRPIRQPAAAAP